MTIQKKDAPARAAGNSSSPRTAEKDRAGRGRSAGDRPFPKEGAPFSKNRERSAKDRPRRSGPGDAERQDRHPQGAAEALILLDQEIMKLLVRRAKLVSRIRGGKENAFTPAAIQAEKSVRLAWEQAALAFSKDPRFSRQLFAMLQDIKILSKEESEKSGTFNLAPPKQPIAGSIAGPQDIRTAQSYLFLAAGLGRGMAIPGLLRSEALSDAVKALTQAGASINAAPVGAGLIDLEISGGSPLSFADKSLYAGSDLFTLHLIIFFALSTPGVCRLSGGSRLKAEDLTGLRNLLPLLGARLAHVIPHTQGLPVNIECSGELPQHMLVPATLSAEGLAALLLAPLVWNRPVTLDLSAISAATATAALALVRPVHRACGADVETHGPKLAYNPAPLTLPAAPDIPLDPLLSAYLLALPVFSGGALALRGRWPGHTPGAQAAEQLLAWAGAVLQVAPAEISVLLPAEPHSAPLQYRDVPEPLLPLLLVLSARQSLLDGTSLALQELTGMVLEDMETAITQEFLQRFGFFYQDGILLPAGNDRSPGPQPDAWTSPEACWSMGLALAAYLRPGLRLANPKNVSEVFPPFWSLYNSLPRPVDPALPPAEKTKEAAGDKPARRRIIAE